MRINTRYISIWKKTYEYIKQLSVKEQEPMTVIVQRLVENKEVSKKVEQIKQKWIEDSKQWSKELKETIVINLFS